MKKIKTLFFLFFLSGIVLILYKKYYQSNAQFTIENILKEAGFDAKKCTISELTDGISHAQLFLVKNNQASFVVRLLAQDSYENNAREIECIEIASKAGYGPKIHFQDKNKRFVIIEYIESQNIIPDLQTSGKLISYLATLIKKIHTGPKFPTVETTCEQVGKFLKNDSKDQGIPNDVIETLLTIKNKICVLFANDPLVPSHRDVHLKNVLCKDEIFYAIDYETANQDTCFVDLAVSTQGFGLTNDEENKFLSIYFGRTRTDFDQAKLYLMKQIILIYWIVELIKLLPNKRISIDLPFNDWEKLLPANPQDINLRDPKHIIGMIAQCLKTIIENYNSETFKQAYEKVYV